jgi:hypothetical protein
MGTIVRLLPRLCLLGVAAGAILILAERAQDAHAQEHQPGPHAHAPAAPELPPVFTDHPRGPHVATPAPAITLSVPLISVPVVEAPAPPAPRALSPPHVPDAPDTPNVDARTVTGAVGTRPEVPPIGQPEPLLPELPELPELPGLPELPQLPDVPLLPEVRELSAPLSPSEGVLGLSASPPSIATAPTAAPDRAATALAAAPAPAPVASTDAGGMPARLDIDVVSPRAPPSETPPPARHPCPDGQTPEPIDADQAGFLSSGVDDAKPAAESFDAALSCASALLRDPLLRPDEPLLRDRDLSRFGANSRRS